MEARTHRAVADAAAGKQRRMPWPKAGWLEQAGLFLMPYACITTVLLATSLAGLFPLSAAKSPFFLSLCWKWEI